MRQHGEFQNKYNMKTFFGIMIIGIIIGSFYLQIVFLGL